MQTDSYVVENKVMDINRYFLVRIMQEHECEKSVWVELMSSSREDIAKRLAREHIYAIQNSNIIWVNNQSKRELIEEFCYCDDCNNDCLGCEHRFEALNNCAVQEYSNHHISDDRLKHLPDQVEYYNCDGTFFGYYLVSGEHCVDCIEKEDK